MNQIILSGIQITISIWEMWMCYEILYMTVLDKKYADKKETIIRWSNIFDVYVWDKEKKSSVKCRNSIRLF